MLREHLRQDVGAAARRIDLALTRHTQGPAKLEAIDILRNKGIRVGPQQGQHHLIGADRGGRAGGVGNAPQGIGGNDRAVIAAAVIYPAAGYIVGGDGARRGAGRGGTGWSRTGRSGAGRGRAEFGDAFIRIIERRVEQDGVFTKEATV